MSQTPQQRVTKKLIHRECLRCEKAFMADSRFLRLCQNCRTSAADHDAGPTTELAVITSFKPRKK